MADKPVDIGLRTRQFALRVVKLFLKLPKSGAGHILGKQMVRAGTSVGAHIAEATHSKSPADFVNKVQGARQEMEETLYWLQLLCDSELVNPALLESLIHEGREIIAILIAMSNKVKQRV